MSDRAPQLVKRDGAAADPIGAALDYLASCQSAEGSWKGDYGGPLFLLPMFVGTAYVVGHDVGNERRSEMARYLRGHQNADGGWGLHVEGKSQVFTTALCYVALRLLDAPPHDPDLIRGREWLLAHGGVPASAPWGKQFLALLNLYDYEGLHPVLPELWLLPDALPLHPGRLWCHCRAVYLPLSYLYAKRLSAPLDDRLRAIRSEIYRQDWEQVDWQSARDEVAEADTYVPTTKLLGVANRVLGAYERRASKRLRQRALALVLDQIQAEDRNTSYLCIGPISKLYHTLVWHFERPDGPELRAHRDRLDDYLYQADDGLKMQGYNSSELWDLAFACQAVVATGRAEEHAPLIRKAHGFLDRHQVREDVPQRERYYRDPSRGGWPFSTRPHGWPITDCTAEGIKTSLALAELVDEPIGRDRLRDAVDLLLFWQNPDGGWATYERTRGPRWLELLNPSSCFADIMIDYSFVECTAASMQALAQYARHYPDPDYGRITAAIDRGREFLLRQQREDGSWEGSWGICFTYGTWFAVKGLRAAGLPEGHPALRRACGFLRRQQLPDGGWGETADSCRERRYVSTDKGQAVMTSWAVMALQLAGQGAGEPAQRGIAFLERSQRPDGSWPAEHIAGVFNRTCAIHYDNYLKIFPLWALAGAGAPRLPEQGARP